MRETTLSWLVCTGRHQSQKGADKSNILPFTVWLYSQIPMCMLLILFLITIVTLITEQYYIQFATNPVILFC
jgi:hypothetical protein